MESVTFFRSYYNAIKNLPAEHKCEVLDAICEYGLDGKEYEGDDEIARAVFELVKPNIDASNRKRAAGRKGGEANGEAENKQAEANGKQTEANGKQTEAENKQTEASGEQTASEGEGEGERDREKDILTTTDVVVCAQPAAAARKKDDVPYEEIAKAYNDTAISYPALRKLSDRRRSAIRARWHGSGYRLDDFKELFKRAEASSFLKGANKNDWRASFDWLVNDTNMAKVLDGNYDDRASPDNGGAEKERWL